MADKKTKSLEYAVDKAELIPETSIRPRSHELMGQRIVPGQWDQYTDQNKAALAADLEDIRAASKIGLENSNRRIYPYGGEDHTPDHTIGDELPGVRHYHRRAKD